MPTERILCKTFTTKDAAIKHADKNYYADQVSYVETRNGNWRIKIKET